MMDGTLNLHDYMTKNYHLAVGESSLPEAAGITVYQLINSVTRVIEFECTFLYEAIHTLALFEEKLQESMQHFEKNLIKVP